MHRARWSILLVLALVTTAAAQEQPRRPRQRRPQADPASAAAVHRDVSYGPHRRNVLDFWQATGDGPRPVLVSIHGGGFRGGNKSVVGFPLGAVLDEGISVAAITYRLSGDAIAPAQFDDCARAVQFLRSKADEWNIDPERFAACGGSAGAGLSLWLGFHDDLAKPDSRDPIERQSTRLKCAVVFNGQTSYDPRFIRDLFPGSDTYKHRALEQLFDVDLDRLDELPPQKYKLFEHVSSITHLTQDDVPVMLVYSRPADAPVTDQNVGIHHAKFGLVLKEKMDGLGIPCVVVTGQGRNEGAGRLEFLKEHLGVPE
jgi:acetyl esterase